MSPSNLLLPLRQLARRPGLTIAIVLIMAAGIGVNGAVFSVVYAVLLKALPYPQAQQLLFISGTGGSSERIPVSLPDFKDWRAKQHSFKDLAAYNRQDFSLSLNGESQYFAGAFVSANYFRTLGLLPKIGRTFLDAEDQSGSRRVVMISERLWREQFGSDPGVVGRTVVINAISYEVVGVAPDQVMHPANIDLYASLGPFSNYPMWADRGNPTLYVIGRLKAATDLSAATTDLKLVCENLATRFPVTNFSHSVSLTPLLETTVAEYQATMVLLFIAAAAILMISAANVAGLQLIRVNDRRKEFVVRVALGANRRALIRQLLIENLILSCFGGLLGLLGANWSQNVISALCPHDVPRFQSVHIDVVVIAVMVLVTITTGIGSGLFPALKASQINPNHYLKGQETLAIERNASQTVLVVTQIAIVTVLLTATGLFTQTVRALHQVDLGFNPNNVLVVGLKLPGVRYRDLVGNEGGVRIADLYARIVEKVRTVPGVESAGINTNPPFVHTSIHSRWPFGITGQPDPRTGDEPFAENQSVSPDYFRTIRLPLLRGRLFDEQDVLGHPPVVIVDAAFVERFFSHEDPIGRQIHDTGPINDRENYTIVGVVPTVRHDEVGAEPRLVQLYFPAGQSADLQERLLLRTNDDPMASLRPVRGAVHAIDPEVPVFEAQRLTDAVSKTLAPQQLTLELISAFSLLALGLAVLGLYGILAQIVSQQTHEIGIRLALGATPRRVLRSMLGKGMTLVGLGLGIGLLIDIALAPVYRSLLYGVTPSDLATLLLTAAILSSAALLGCLAPALRAANLDPIEAIRER